MKLKRNSFWLLLVLCFANLLFFYKLFFPNPSLFYTPDFGRSDFWHFNYPIKDYLGKSLKDFQLPLWSKEIGNGFPLFAESQVGALNFFNLSLFFLLPTWLAMNLLYVSIFLFNSIGCYLLALELSLSLFPALFFAILFPFSGFFISHIPHTNLIHAASYLPWLFLFIIRFFKHKRIRDLLLFSFILSQQIFCGHSQISFISILGIVIFIIFYYLSHKPEKHLKEAKKSKSNLLYKLKIISLGYILAAIFFGLCLAAVQLLPTLELKKSTIRRAGLDYQTATQYPYPFKHLITFLNPYLLGNPKNGTYPQFSHNWGIFWENTAYIGILPLILFIAAFFRRKKNIFHKMLTALLICSFILIFGKYSPLYFIFSIPPFNWFRVPSRMLLLVSFSALLMASIFIESALKKAKNKFLGKLIFVLIIIISFLDLLINFGNYHPVVEKNTSLSSPEIINFLKDQNIKGKVFHYNEGISKQWNKIFFSTGWRNIEPYLFFKNSLDADLNLLFGIPSIDQFQGLVPKRGELIINLISQALLEENNQVVINPFFKNMLDIYSIEYFISPMLIKNNSDFGLQLVKTIKPTDSILPSFYIYKNLDFLPYIRIVDDYKVATNLKDFTLETNNGDYDPSKSVILEKVIDLKKEMALEKSLQIIEEGKQTKMIITINKEALLIINDSYFPGWKALIDKQKTLIYPANINQKAIVIPKGNHLVEIKYEPDSFKIGLIISFITHLAVLLAYFLFGNRNLKIGRPFVHR